MTPKNKPTVDPEDCLVDVNESVPGNYLYWMGRVDASLDELKRIVGELSSNNAKHWTDLSAWQNTIEQRLMEGSNKFAFHDNEIADMHKKIETNRKDIEERQAKTEEKATPKFGSWEWFNEKALIPIVVALVVSLGSWFFTDILPKLVAALPK